VEVHDAAALGLEVGDSRGRPSIVRRTASASEGNTWQQAAAAACPAIY
jgi:hypothetical protein